MSYCDLETLTSLSNKKGQKLIIQLCFYARIKQIICLIIKQQQQKKSQQIS